jgi:hypothetical protein
MMAHGVENRNAGVGYGSLGLGLRVQLRRAELVRAAVAALASFAGATAP